METKKLIRIIVLAMCCILMAVPVFAEDNTGEVSGSLTHDSLTLDQPDSNHVYFGTYPQTEIVAEASQSGTYGRSWAKESDYDINEELYTELQSANWNGAGDYKAADGTKYHRIKKSEATYSTSGNSDWYNWSDSTTYHYFRYEPISWRILKSCDGDAFLLAEKVLDDQRYNKTDTSITWEKSTVRSWLNSTFYDRAFTGAEKGVIKTTDVVNADNNYYGTAGGNDTKDKIFLLSESEVYGSNATQYGFASSYNTPDAARRTSGTTYARAMGAYSETDSSYLGNCYWWLRSPGHRANYAAYVDNVGYVGIIGGYVDGYNQYGIRPALHINLKSDNPAQPQANITDMNLSDNLMIYDGTAKEPEVTINGLTEGTDYIVGYNNNKEVGTATAFATGIGEWSGTLSRTFEIKYDITEEGFALSKTEYTYDGNAKTPDVIIADLEEGRDFEVEYTDNVNVGTAKVTINAIGDYVGSTEKTFTIKKASIAGENAVTGNVTGSVSLTKPDENHVYLGTYPQTEIVAEASQCGTYGKSWAADSDYDINADLYAQLQSADWNEAGDYTAADGIKYHRIKKSDATYSTSGSSDECYNWSDSTTYHYFRYEPISWRILKSGDGDAFLLAEKALDDQKYNEKSTSITWEKSTVRSWLNSTFYDRAFTGAEKSVIKTTEVGNAENNYYGTEGGNATKDKIFLLSESEVYGSSATHYGFASSYNTPDAARRTSGTTYARAMGAYSESLSYIGNCYWWLRSPGNYTNMAASVNFKGYVNYNGNYVNAIDNGIRPALQINLKSDDPLTVELTIDDITLEYENCIYDGTEKKPAVTVEGLPEEDYTVEYSNNKEVGTATVTVTGMGDWNGTLTKTFEILPADTIKLTKDEYTYDGNAKEPGVTVKGLTEDSILDPETDYDVAYKNNTDAGTAFAIITMKGNYSGRISKEFTIKPADISEQTITLAQSLFICDDDGDAKEPKVTVSGIEEGTNLEADKDYTVSYKDNVNPGTATATATGKGNFTGSISKTFRIGYMITESIVLSDDSFEYDGEEHKPGVTLGELEEGKDFEVSYSNNIEVGTATVKVTGIGSYIGTKTASFTITATDIENLNVILSSEELGYTGKKQTPEVTVRNSNNKLIAADNYDVLWSGGCIEIGTYECTVTFKGNFNGTKTASFRIIKGTPEYEVPGNLTATCNQKLSEIALPTGFAWNNKDQSVGEQGIKTFKATFTPEDTTNYKAVSDIDIEVSVKHDFMDKWFSDEDNHWIECQCGLIAEKGQHSYEIKDVAPTCTEKGYSAKVCSTCGNTITESYISAKGHSFGPWETIKESSCLGEGSEQRVCGECGFIETRNINPEGHEWETEYMVDKEATCTVEGSESIHCRNCDAVKNSRVIKALGHDLIHHDGKTPTCTEKGWNAYDTCNRCEYTTYNEIPALGHNYEHYKNPAGLMKNGSEYDRCANCNQITNKKTLYGYSTSYVKSFKVSKGKKCFTAKWKKQSKKNQKKFNGYQLRYSTRSDMAGAKYKNIGKSKKSVKIKKLGKKTRYYVQLRTYTGGFYSSWSTKTVVTK